METNFKQLPTGQNKGLGRQRWKLNFPEYMLFNSSILRNIQIFYIIKKLSQILKGQSIETEYNNWNKLGKKYMMGEKVEK